VTFEGYDAFKDPYLYNGSQCLKNRLGLRDPKRLAAFELEMSTLRSDEPLPHGRFGPHHYRRVHWHLFRDVYAWAGRYRTVRTGKDGNWFCYPEHIAASMNALFQRLERPEFAPGATSAEFLDAAAEFLTELNAIHPFREGNGRAQMTFVALLTIRAGRMLDLSRLLPQTFLPAMVASFSDHTAPLRAELASMLVLHPKASGM
jgi:cell filamentation protein